MLISRKIKQSFIWVSLLVLASTMLTGFLPASRAEALSQDGRNRIIASGLAFCLYDGLAIKEDNDEYNGDITDYWEVEGNREVVVVGLSIDKTDGLITCNQVLDNLGPVAGALGLTGTDSTSLRESLESKIIGNYSGGGPIRKFAGGINGQDFEDRARDFANNEIAAYVASIPLTDKDLAERLLPVVEICFKYSDQPYSNHADHYIDDAKQSNGNPIYLEWKDDPWKDIASKLELGTNEGVVGFTDVTIGGVIETGYDDDNLDDGADRRYQWRFFALGYDFLQRTDNNKPTFSGNADELYDTYALASCKTIKENYKDKIFKEYVLNAEGRLTIDGKTLEELIDAEDIEDVNLTLASGGTPSCEGADALGWIACPFVTGLLNLSDTIFQSFIVPFLTVDPINTNSGQVYTIWSSFRTVGNVLLVFGLLFIVFGQAIGGGLVDAYTAKKAMPRIFVAAILINLSIYLVAFMVDMGNILGAGVGEMITSPLAATGEDKFILDGILGLVTMVGLILVFLIPIMIIIFYKKKATPDEKTSLAARFKKGALYFGFFIALPLLLLILSIFFTLILRLGTILLLCVISPVALALFVMPSTDKYAKKWFDLLVKSILVYPIIVAIFAIAVVLGSLLSSSSNGIDFVGVGNGISELTDKSAILLLTPAAPLGIFESFFNVDGVGLLFSIAAILVMFAPLAMIPFSFKLAGGLMGSILSVATKGRGGLDKMVRGDKHNPHGRFYKFGGKDGWVSSRYDDAAKKGTRSIGSMLRRTGKPAVTPLKEASGETLPTRETSAVDEARERSARSRTLPGVPGAPGFGVPAGGTPPPVADGAPKGVLDLDTDPLLSPTTPGGSASTDTGSAPGLTPSFTPSVDRVGRSGASPNVITTSGSGQTPIAWRPSQTKTTVVDRSGKARTTVNSPQPTSQKLPAATPDDFVQPNQNPTQQPRSTFGSENFGVPEQQARDAQPDENETDPDDVNKPPSQP